MLEIDQLKHDYYKPIIDKLIGSYCYLSPSTKRRNILIINSQDLFLLECYIGNPSAKLFSPWLDIISKYNGKEIGEILRKIKFLNA